MKKKPIIRVLKKEKLVSWLEKIKVQKKTRLCYQRHEPQKDWPKTIAYYKSQKYITDFNTLYLYCNFDRFGVWYKFDKRPIEDAKQNAKVVFLQKYKQWSVEIWHSTINKIKKDMKMYWYNQNWVYKVARQNIQMIQ